VLSNSIQQLLLVIRNGRQEVHARTLTSVCKSGIQTKYCSQRVPIVGTVGYNIDSPVVQFPKRRKGGRFDHSRGRPMVLLRHCRRNRR